MITKVISPKVYKINSNKNFSGEMKAHYNQLKPFITPNTSGWVLNVLYLKKALEQLGLEMFKGINVIINFKDLSLLTLQLLNTDVKTFLSFQSGNVHPGTNLSMEFFRKR